MPIAGWFLGLFGFLFFLAGCTGFYPETQSRRDEAKQMNRFAGVVYGLKNRDNEGEIVATLLYADGKTRYAGVIGVSCNGEARALQKDDRMNREKIYLYSICHRTGIINGLVVPRRSSPGSRFFLVGTYLGSWSAGLSRELPNDMVLTPDGRFLYAGGDRGSLIGFRVQRSGQLKRIDRPLRKKLPSEERILSLGITADGTALVAGGVSKKRDFLRASRIDAHSGKLHPEGQKILTPGPVEGLVAPDDLSNGNILAGVVLRKDDSPALILFETGETFGIHPPFFLPLARFEGRIHQVLFSPSGRSLFVTSEGRNRCSGIAGEIRRYSVGEYGRSLRPGPFLCAPVGGSFHNATWDWKDRLLISQGVDKIPEDPERPPRMTSGRVQGDHGIVFVPGMNGGGD